MIKADNVIYQGYLYQMTYNFRGKQRITFWRKLEIFILRNVKSFGQETQNQNWSLIIKTHSGPRKIEIWGRQEHILPTTSKEVGNHVTIVLLCGSLINKDPSLIQRINNLCHITCVIVWMTNVPYKLKPHVFEHLVPMFRYYLERSWDSRGTVS